MVIVQWISFIWNLHSWWGSPSVSYGQLWPEGCYGQSQVVILDDWRPDHGALDVSSTLLWLESATLRINRPLNLYSGHLDFRPTQPTFLTCNWQSLFVPKGCWSESELLMLRSRLTIYRFQHRIENLKDIPACPCCFTMFILSGGKNVAKFLVAGFPSV